MSNAQFWAIWFAGFVAGLFMMNLVWCWITKASEEPPTS